MALKSRAFFGGRCDMSGSCHGQWHHDMGFSVNEHQNRNHNIPLLLSDLGRSIDNVSSAIPDRPWCDQRAHDLNYFQDSVSCKGEDFSFSCEGEDFNFHEITMYQKLLNRQRNLIKMKLTHQLRQLQSVEDDRMFLEQMIDRQHQLRQFLRKDYEMISRCTSKRGNIKQDQDMNIVDTEDEKEAWSRQSMELENFSGSSQKTVELSDLRSPQAQKPQLKTKHCRHFLKGYCERGDSCGFRHDRSVFCSDKQKVFLGGLPPHLTVNLLREKLEEQGFTVLNQPKILRCFSPQVCLGSVEEASRLVEKGTIVIDGTYIRVRPYKGFSRDNKKTPADEVERSVFLGGLAPLTTINMIKDDIGIMGMKVVNMPDVKTGYSPKVTLETVNQAQTLLNLRQVQINGVMVSVRQFANIRSSSRRRTNKGGKKLRNLQRSAKVKKNTDYVDGYIQ